jgi:hypothetical protein
MNYTPYEAHKLVNKALKEADIDKVIPPQMMYNYTTAKLNKGLKPMIPSFQVEENNKVKTYITEEDFNVWLERYIKKATLLAQL